MNFTAGGYRLRSFLRVLAALFFVAAVLYEFGALAGPLRDYSRQLPFVSNSVVKVGLLGLLCLFAAGDLRKHFGLVVIVAAAHILSLAAMATLMLFGADVTRVVDVAGTLMPAGRVLWGAIALDGVVTALILAFYFGARGTPPAEGVKLPLTPGETRLKIGMLLFGLLFAAGAVVYEIGPLLPATRDFFIELPFVTNSVVKVGALALVCFYVQRDVGARLPLVGVLIGAHLISILAQLVLLIFADTTLVVTIGSWTTTIAALLWGGVALDTVVAFALYALYHGAWNNHLAPRFLAPVEYRCLIALAETVVWGPGSTVPPAEVAANSDRYISGIRARRRWVDHAALLFVQFHPLFYLKAPFSELDLALRIDHLKTHFYRDVVLQLIPDWWRRFVQAMIRLGKQLCYVGYYNDERSFAAIGYLPFKERPRYQPLVDSGAIPAPAPHPLKVDRAGDVEGDQVETDVCVIGSGAGGAMLAYHLAERGRDVLVLERGRYVEPRAFTHDEVDMIAKLYADGVFQQTEDFRFTVLQGSCVGGSTTVNNAVCFDPPDQVLARWNSPAHNAGLDLAALSASVAYVRQFLDVQTQTRYLNPSGKLYLEGAQQPWPPLRQLEAAPVEANIRGCVGCGYCNIGCAWGKKLSMLATTLPWAQQRFPNRVRIISECEVRRLRVMSGQPPRVIDARCQRVDGRPLTVKANTFVVSAGAVASSYVLLKSGIGRGLPVGRHLSFNMGSPLTGDFDSVLNAHDGLQISHYGKPLQGRGFVFETWWNPPATQALNMPGWFQDHFNNMKRYPNMMAVGVLVGTAPTAYIKEALTRGPGIVFTPNPADLHKLAEGLVQAGEILFAVGAKRVMLNTWGYDVFTTPAELVKLFDIADDPSYITLATGHPQGGNAISIDPARGVVDQDFRVHGYGNVYVCDASLFPTSLTVNPQLTTMALAHLAAQRIA